MTEIKFRGKRIDNREWVHGYYAYKILDDKHIILVEKSDAQRYSSYFVEIEVLPETVGQHVETLIFGNTEIFVGDKVKAYKYGDKELDPFVHEITYRSGTFWFGNWTFVEFLNVFRYVEIVGNIHDGVQK